jgi:hypothetical protein
MYSFHIWEIYNIKAEIKPYVVDATHLECDRPYPTIQYPPPENQLSSSAEIRFCNNTLDLFEGKDRLTSDGSPEGLGWGEAIVYAGTLEHLGPLFPLAGSAIASLVLKEDMRRHPEIYRNGQY